MTNPVTLPYGKSSLTLPVEDLELLGELKTAEIPPLADPAATLAEVLKNPIGTPPLRQIVNPGQKVAIIVNDDTRVANTSFFLPAILTEIEGAGVNRNDIRIVFANGTHRLLPEDVQRQLVGNDVYENYTLVNHDCRDKASLVYVGTTSSGNRIEINRVVTEADTVILTGSITYHYFAGYGGGRKAVVPGVAGYDTIHYNHSFMLKEGADLGNLHANPVHEDFLEAVAMVKPAFLLNVVLNEKKEFLGMYAGDYIKAHAEGCRMVDRAYGVPIKEAAELVVASCGGYPKDLNMYQAQKTLDNAVRAVKQDGVVILLAECPEGLGSDVLEDWANKYCSPQEICDALRENFVLGGHKAFALTRLTEKARIVFVSSLPEDIVSKLYFTPAKSINEALAAAKPFLPKRPRTYVMPQGSLTLPLLRPV